MFTLIHMIPVKTHTPKYKHRIERTVTIPAPLFLDLAVACARFVVTTFCDYLAGRMYECVVATITYTVETIRTPKKKRRIHCEIHDV